MFDEQPDAPLHGECAAEISNLRMQLALVLPMAKAHAAAHPVGSNADIVRHAEEVLRACTPPDDGRGTSLGVAPCDEALLREALERCIIKLSRYREQHGIGYIGAVAAEYDAVIKTARAALSGVPEVPRG
jgi:hypothetical protein